MTEYLLDGTGSVDMDDDRLQGMQVKTWVLAMALLVGVATRDNLRFAISEAIADYAMTQTSNWMCGAAWRNTIVHCLRSVNITHCPAYRE